MSIRDRRRAKIYAWVASPRRRLGVSEVMHLDAGQALVASIWKAERARSGLGRPPVPELSGRHGPPRRGLAFVYGRRMSILAYCMKQWGTCHEVAHLLTGTMHEAHGPRFVGSLSGLLSRHAAYDAGELLASAQLDMPQVSPQSIGAQAPAPLPTLSISEQLLALAPISDVDAAIELGLHWHVHARWFRGKQHALQPSARAPGKASA